MKDKRLDKEERRRPLVEANLIGDSRNRSTWPPRPRLSSAKKISTTLGRILGQR
jgi:hypothetical protein